MPLKGETKADRQRRVDWLMSVVAEAETGDGCREWPWGKSAKGYANIAWKGRTRRAGHVVLELLGRSRPSSAHHQLHSCDNPPCVAPWHLHWGTNAENRAESLARGGHFTKLSEADVLAIYQSEGVKQRDLAAHYGVTQRVIWQIKSGQTWTRVTGHVPSATCRIHPPTGEPAATWLELTNVTNFKESA